MARSNSAVRLATLAVAIALVCVFTMVVRIPLGAGYLNLCDVAIAFCAYALGPVTALVAGALGPAFAGLEGLLMALVLKAMKHSMASKILAAAICILIVPAGYYVLSGLFLVGFEAALADIPGNLIQSVVGAVAGFALSEAVIKAYPPVKSFAW